MTVAGRARRRVSPRTRRQIIIGLLYILPSFVLMMTFNVIPIFLSAFFSFTKYNMASPPEWIGLDNYARLFTNRVLTESLSNTVRYVLITVPAQTVLSLLIAVFIAEHMKTRYGSLMRSVIFIPVIVSLIASATVWNIMYQPKGGLINQLLEFLGAQPVNFLGKKASALPSVAVVAIWKGTGYYMVIYYAGVMNIPTDVREAAIVDGATPVQRFFHITLPLLRPILIYVLITSLIGGLQMFDVPQILTNGTGDPARSSMTLIMYLNRHLFSKNYGLGGALSVMLFIITGILSLIVFRFNSSSTKSKH